MRNIALISLITSMILLAGCVTQNTENAQIQNDIAKGKLVGSNGDINVSLMYSNINALPKQPISEEEKEGLIEMREEEKLA